VRDHPFRPGDFDAGLEDGEALVGVQGRELPGGAGEEQAVDVVGDVGVGAAGGREVEIPVGGERGQTC